MVLLHQCIGKEVLQNGHAFKPPPSSPSTTTLCIELNQGEFLDSRVVRLQKGWNLQFVCGKGLLGNAVQLNICGTDKHFKFGQLSSVSELDSGNVRQLSCDFFGAFKYEFFLASDPKHRLDMDTSLVITHIAKLLGPLPEWEDRMRVSKEAGYNVCHLTPVQTLGVSNSSYSIADYHQLNPLFQADFQQLEKFVQKMETEWHMFTIQDVVWNHAAKNAQWLWDHPECAFNCDNSPHMIPAYVIDRVLQHFSKEIGESKWEHKGLPAFIDSESHLLALRRILESEVFPSIRLHEFFQVDVDKTVQDFKQKASGSAACENLSDSSSVTVMPDLQYRRFGASVDLDQALKVFNKPRSDASSEEDRLEKCSSEFRYHLENLNEEAVKIALDHCYAGINATMGHVAYERVDGITNYFLHRENTSSWQEDEKLAYNSSTSPFLMACNGWVMNADPLVNFAEAPSTVYLRRELVCWGDCVKLNYGRKPEDCPYLWNYMKQYSEQCAKIFHGFRIDNCHSTPIHVAEYLLAAARKIRKNLYVVAELFTGNEALDNLFVNRLGITSLIRECQNAPDSHEQGRFVYRYGGDPVGAFHFKSTRPAPPSVSHALFYDQTHDNPSPYQKRTPYDYVPTAAMTAMAYCASGTVRGYDELVPFNIDVVREERLYHNWSEISADANLMGLIKARRLFNVLHADLAENGFSEIFVDQVNEDIWTPQCKDIHIADDITGILFEVKTVESQLQNGVMDANSTESGVQESVSDRIEGLKNFSVEVYENVPLDKSMAVDVSEHSIHFKLFTSGSAIAFKIQPKKDTATACAAIEKAVGSEEISKELQSHLRKLEMQTFNYILFRCEAEEQSVQGEGAYDVPNFGKLVYCGLEGIHPVLKRIQETNDLGHPLCCNLRDGSWIADYIVGRLERLTELQPIAQLFKGMFGLLKQGVPNFLQPAYFELIFSYLYKSVECVLNEKIFSVSHLPKVEITEKLSFSSISFLAPIPSAKLPLLASGVSENSLRDPPSLAAGLPHFAEGIWRNWGRDTFIALPGVLLLTGRLEEARCIILAFAGTLRHGLIPNLLAEGKAARYNCRDAVWFWLVAVLKYVDMVPGGEKLLGEQVLRLYPTDDAQYGEQEKTEALHETMYEALQRHFNKIFFRERNAGHQIDEQMTDQGFNLSAFIDHESGLVFGGNQWNCGTWMDKMGSSEKAGNKGQPATPRDGAAVELQGLALFVAQKLAKLSGGESFPHTHLKSETTCWTWTEWAAKLKESFAHKFYVDQNNQDHAGFTDFQLRPNFCMALDAVPNIVEPEKAWSALKIAGEVLGAPLGICTLDPSDWAYNGNYNNDDDGTNKSTAKGWNYHQGPEWLWVAGVYLSAKLKVAHLLKPKTRELPDHLKGSLWCSLPELTNQNGQPCSHSCPAQAWSVGCFLETCTAWTFFCNNDNFLLEC
uniref:Glycogen debranching enzyme n=1 Tax=Ditylenchus dipsaci TaxID=166011 RepID=A0A915CSE8_9BILA